MPLQPSINDTSTYELTRNDTSETLVIYRSNWSDIYFEYTAKTKGKILAKHQDSAITMYSMNSTWLGTLTNPDGTTHYFHCYISNFQQNSELISQIFFSETLPNLVSVSIHYPGIEGRKLNYFYNDHLQLVR